MNLSGADLVFVIFPMAINLMPFKNFWAIIFYLLMLSLGIDSMFGFFEFIGATIEEYIPGKREILRF